MTRRHAFGRVLDEPFYFRPNAVGSLEVYDIILNGFQWLSRITYSIYLLD